MLFQVGTGGLSGERARKERALFTTLRKKQSNSGAKGQLGTEASSLFMIGTVEFGIRTVTVMTPTPPKT